MHRNTALSTRNHANFETEPFKFSNGDDTLSSVIYQLPHNFTETRKFAGKW